MGAEGSQWRSGSGCWFLDESSPESVHGSWKSWSGEGCLSPWSPHLLSSHTPGWEVSQGPRAAVHPEWKQSLALSTEYTSKCASIMPPRLAIFCIVRRLHATWGGGCSKVESRGCLFTSLPCYILSCWPLASHLIYFASISIIYKIITDNCTFLIAESQMRRHQERP